MSPIPARIPSLRRHVTGVVRAGAWTLLLGSLAAPAARAATLRPELTLEARYDDNVHTREHGVDDLVRVISPGLLAAGTSPLAEWRVWARRSVVSYTRDRDIPTSTTDAASVHALTGAGRPLDLRLVTELRRSRDDTETDDRSVLVPGDFRSGSGTLRLYSPHLEGAARVAAWDYRRPDQTDGTRRELELSLIPQRTSTHDWLLSYRGRELDVSGRRSLTSQAALAGFRRRHTTRLGSRVEAGVAEVDFEDGSPRARRGAFTAALTLYEPGREETVAEVRVEQDAETAASAEARRHVGGGVVSVSWRRRLEALGGYETRPVVDQRAFVSLADTLGRGMAVGLEGSYSWTRPFRGSGSGTDAYRAAASFSLPLRAWVTARLGYDFLRQTAPDRPDPLHFRRSRVLLSLTARLP